MLLPSIRAVLCAALAALYLSSSAHAQSQALASVSTPEELREAIELEKRHIIITNHLDMRGFAPANNPTVPLTLLRISENIKSIRGQCEQSFVPPEGVSLPTTPQRFMCVILVSAPLLEVEGSTAESAQFLMTSVYVALARPPPTPTTPSITLLSVLKGDLMLHTTYLAGDRTRCRGLYVSPGQRIHVRESELTAFGHPESSAAVYCDSGCRSGFRFTTFKRNQAGANNDGGSALGLWSGAAAWFEDCYFTEFDSTKTLDEQFILIEDTSARYWHKPQHKDAINLEGTPPVVSGASLLSLTATDVQGPPFLASPDQIIPFQDIAREEAQLAGLRETTVTALTFAEAPSGGGGGTPTAAIIGGVAGGVGLLLIGAFAAWFLRKRARAGSSSTAHKLEGQPDGTESMAHGGAFSAARLSSGLPTLQSTGGASNVAMTSANGTPSHHNFGGSAGLQRHLSLNSAPTNSPRGAHGVIHPATASSAQSGPAPMLTTTGGVSTVGHRPQSVGASRDSGISAGQVMDRDALEEALDEIFDNRILFLGRYEMYGQVHRRVGGQGVVQFVRGRYDEEDYAVKFFLQRKGFEREERLYLRPELRAMMPAVRDILPNTTGSICTAAGYIFPPCIIVEKGQSLNEWALRVKPDFPTILTVLTHILERLNALHAVGIAHRDIKPGNVIWRPKHFSWTLIDYGCAAEIGTTCELSFSLQYAPPEAIRGYEAGQRTTLSDPAADMWALGVIAYELLTSSTAFPKGLEAKDVRDQITGRKPLPWETPDMKLRKVKELRMLRRSVNSCLERDPCKRPTSTDLLHNWNSLFDKSTIPVASEASITTEATEGSAAADRHVVGRSLTGDGTWTQGSWSLTGGSNTAGS